MIYFPLRPHLFSISRLLPQTVHQPLLRIIPCILTISVLLYHLTQLIESANSLFAPAPIFCGGTIRLCVFSHNSTFRTWLVPPSVLVLSLDPLVNVGIIKQQCKCLIRNCDNDCTRIIGGCIRYGGPVLLPCTPCPLSTHTFK
jgi:hypothetical protein